MISFSQKGDFSNLTHFLKKSKDANYLKVLGKYGDRGVAALSAATPVDSGETAGSWYYKIEKGVDTTAIVYYNSSVNKGFPVAVMLQYGHGTRTGGWVQGRDYINPAIKPVFDKIASDAWAEVTAL